MPDCPTTWSPNYEKRGSTHSFLREYAALQQHTLDEFENKEGFVYAVRSIWCPQRPESDPQNEESPWTEEEPLLFSTLANCIDYPQAEQPDDYGDFDRYVASKTKVDSNARYDSNHNEIVLNHDFQPLKVSIGNLNEHDTELVQLLQNAFIKIPVLFKRGDIVIDHTASIPHPFVLSRLKFRGLVKLAEHVGGGLSLETSAAIDNRIALPDERHGWNDSHTVACGYELGQHYNDGPLTSPYDLCHDALGASDNYLNLKFYHGPLEGELGILEAAPLFIRGAIGIEAFLYQTRSTSHACHVK